MSSYKINLFHILFVAPLLILLGLYHNHPDFPIVIWKMLIYLGIGILCYHSWLFYNKYYMGSA